MKSLHRLLIVGGGAGGLELATQLGNTLGKNKLANITLVDQLLMHFDSVAIFEAPFGTSKSPKGTKIVDKYACGSPGRPAYARYDTTRCHNFTSTNDLSTVLWTLYFAFGKTSGTTVYQGLSASLLRRFLGRQRWKPLWHEVAAGSLDSNVNELNFKVHAHRHSFYFELGKMVNLNRKEKYIELAPISDPENNELLISSRKIFYDTLIISIGSIANDFGTKGAKENCFYLDKYHQLYRFRQHFLNQFLLMEHNINTPLNIAIIGGGATGVELAAELREASKNAFHYGLAHINPLTQVNITLIEASPTLLQGLSTKLIQSVMEVLKDRNISVMTGERVVEVTPAGVKTESNTWIPAQIKVWTAGIKAPAFLKNLEGLETNSLNQLLVKPTLQTTMDNAIFAFGDCASCPYPGHDKPVPARAQAAHQQADFLIKAINLLLHEKELPTFRYKDQGSLITLSHYTAIGSISNWLKRFKLEGKIARLTYLLLYKMHQYRLHGFWNVFLMTLADFLLWKIKPRLKLH
ncbi:MAG: hypothetical protein LEGION0398_MBIBDBAK_00560 [Legionellaceae bacterium]